MPNYTTNLNLEKPLDDEQYNINVFNNNADKIDQFAGQTPPYALTANSLISGAKINGVNFKGDTDIITGAGFYYDTVTYSEGDLVFIYNQDGALELYKSLQNGNVGHSPLTTTVYWQKQDLGGSGGRNIGEIIMSPLPLTDAGLHLLDGARLSGGGIYSRFVDYIAELYQNTPTTGYKYNVTAVGSIANNDGVLSGFSTSNYARIGQTLPTTANLEIVTKTTFTSANTTSTLLWTTADYPVGFTTNRNLGIYNLSSTSWISGATQYDLNRAIWVKVVWNGSSINVYGMYDDGYNVKELPDNWTLEASITTSVNIFGGYDMYLGFNGKGSTTTNQYLEGTIDLNCSYINIDNARWWTGATEIKSCFCSETNWQESIANYGVCGKFVYDSENNTVRLPKITGIIEGTVDLSALGDLVQAGLPNLSGYFGSSNTGGIFNQHDNKLFKPNSTISLKSPSLSSNTYSYTQRINFNASSSNSIYGNSSTVQPQTIKAFYYIVIATSAKTDIQVDIDEIATDLNTLIPNHSDVISGYATPDYSSFVSVSVTAGDSFTVPANGWIYAERQQNAATANTILQITINGYRVVYMTAYNANAAQTAINCWFPVAQGDVVVVASNNTSGSQMRFYPMRGTV